MSAICQKCYRSGYPDEKIGQNCESCKDGKIVRDPPYSERVEVLPEPMTCGRRFDYYFGSVPAHRDRGENQDRWHKHKSNGDRVCSFCGSLHPEDFLRLVRECAESPADAKYGSVPEIELSDKGYKVYVKQPGVHNAHEGGIKFYKQHLKEVTSEQELIYFKAVRASHARFEKYLEESRATRFGQSGA